MAKIKTIKTSSTVIIDKETGEVLETSVNKMQMIADKEQFALVYVSFWNAIMGCKLSTADMQLLSYLIKHYCKGTPFGISKYIKEEVAKVSGKSPSTYNNCATVLVRGGFLIKKDNRNYIINPEYAFEGSSNNRNKAIIELSNF